MVNPQKIKKKVRQFRVQLFKGKCFHSKREEKEIVRRNQTKGRPKASMANNEPFTIRSRIRDTLYCDLSPKISGSPIP
jgi:hypothetical protein